MSSDSLFDSDDDVIIAKTPQKFCNKKPKTSKLSHFGNCNPQDLLKEFIVTRNEASFAVAANDNAANLNDCYKRPFIFFEIADILGFREVYQPVNTKLKTIGLYKQHYLTELCSIAQIKPSAIALNTKLLEKLPKDDDVIEAFGFITFQNQVSLPVFVVEFWTNVGHSNCDRYLKCLQLQKRYVPLCYKAVNNFNSSLDYTEYIDYTFEEIDESCLNRKVEYIEQICSEIDQIMRISDDVFV